MNEVLQHESSVIHLCEFENCSKYFKRKSDLKVHEVTEANKMTGNTFKNFIF